MFVPVCHCFSVWYHISAAHLVQGPLSFYGFGNSSSLEPFEFKYNSCCKTIYFHIWKIERKAKKLFLFSLLQKEVFHFGYLASTVFFFLLWLHDPHKAEHLNAVDIVWRHWMFRLFRYNLKDTGNWLNLTASPSTSLYLLQWHLHPSTLNLFSFILFRSFTSSQLHKWHSCL